MTEIEILTEKFRQDLFALTGSNYYVNIKRYKSNDLTAERIIDEVANYFNISIDELQKHTRKREYINRKFICYYFIKEYCYYESLKSIGRMFNNADHSSVINGLKRFSDYYETEAIFRMHVENIKNILLNIKNNNL